MRRHEILQKEPMRPARETIKRRTPRIITGHWRNLTHVSAGSFVSQIPAPMIGIEIITASKFMNPMMLLLIAIFFWRKLCGGFGFEMGLDFVVCFNDEQK
jgi:hypothetical protein